MIDVQLGGHKSIYFLSDVIFILTFMVKCCKQTVIYWSKACVIEIWLLWGANIKSDTCTCMPLYIATFNFTFDDLSMSNLLKVVLNYLVCFDGHTSD